MTVKISFKHKNGFLTQPVSPMTFPAGETHLKGLESISPENYEYIIVDVRFSGASIHKDLFTLRMFIDAMDGVWDAVPAYLLIPYLPGARADRGVPLGAKLYSKFIADGNFTRIYILDPHSPVMPELMQKEHVKGYITEFPFERIIRREIQDEDNHTRPQMYVGVIAPDKGAVGRATRAAQVMGVPVYTAGKTRDFETGKLTGFHMETDLPSEGRFLIVDDICDGGGTFIGLAEAIKKTNPKVVLDLWVTHGVFSRGLYALEDHFEEIHTTDSYMSSADTSMLDCIFKVHSVTPYLYTEAHNHFTQEAS